MPLPKSDLIRPFQVEGPGIRGRLVRLGPTIDEIVRRHDYPEPVALLLAEAAALEGASRWQYFWRVLFPLLMPTTLFVLINALINSFRLVDHIIVMTRGGPNNASSLLLYYIYQVGFSFWDSAYAAAITVVLLLILGITAFVKFRFLDRRTHYQ